VSYRFEDDETPARQQGMELLTPKRTTYSIANGIFKTGIRINQQRRWIRRGIRDPEGLGKRLTAAWHVRAARQKRDVHAHGLGVGEGCAATVVL
jgi:uncharacterized protein (DUF1800 family)